MPANPIGPYGSLPQESLLKGGRGASTEESGASKKAGSTPPSPETDPKSAGTGSTEKVQISQAARDLLELTDLMNEAKTALDRQPEVRSERIRQVRERLEAGVYDTQAVRDELAHRLSSILKDLPLDDA